MASPRMNWRRQKKSCSVTISGRSRRCGARLPTSDQIGCSRAISISAAIISTRSRKSPLDDIKRVATQYLTENNLTVISLNPKGSLTAKTEGPKVVAAGEIQKFELSNGLRLLVREDPRLPLVAMGAVFRGGLLAENAARQRHHAFDGESAAERNQNAHR